MHKIPVFVRVILVLLASTLVACTVYPFFYGFTQNWIGAYESGRVFRRVWMIAVILGLIISARWLGMRPPTQVGYRLHRGWFRNLALGTVIAWVFLGLVAFVYRQIGAWQPSTDQDWMEEVLTGFLRGAAVAGIEEYIFRGMIFLSMCQRWSWQRAAVVSSLIFSSLHFLEGRGIFDGPPDAWWSGFAICGTMLGAMAQRITLFPDAASLFVVGMILCYALIKTGTLWYSVGLHGGWVWASSVLSDAHDRTGEIDLFWIGGSRMYDGVIPFAGMLIVLPLTIWLMRLGWLAREAEGSPE